MNPDAYKDPNIQRLMVAHPLLFKGRETRTISDLPSGWYGLVDELCSAIERTLTLQELAALEVLQIKSKLGTLRFYHSIEGLNKANLAMVAKLLRQAEKTSGITCEECGQPATGSYTGKCRTWCSAQCE